MREGQASGKSLSADGDNINRDSKYQILSNHKLFRTPLPPSRFKETVMKGRAGTTMPAFGGLLSSDEIWAVFDFLLARDRVQ